MSDGDEIHDGAEGFKEWAETQVTQQLRLYESMLDQHSALYRWILAARLSVNGGAAIAILNTDRIDPKLALISLAFFFVGAVAAIVAAELDQKALQGSFGPNASAIGFWSKARVTGKFNATRLSELGQEAAGVAGKSLPGKWAGWVSVGAFVLGVTVIAIGLGSDLICGKHDGVC